MLPDGSLNVLEKLIKSNNIITANEMIKEFFESLFFINKKRIKLHVITYNKVLKSCEEYIDFLSSINAEIISCANNWSDKPENFKLDITASRNNSIPMNKINVCDNAFNFFLFEIPESKSCCIPKIDKIGIQSSSITWIDATARNLL